MKDKKREEGFVLGRMVCERYGITLRTLQRWVKDERLGFPEPLALGGRNWYFRISELEEWERRRAAESVRKSA